MKKLKLRLLFLFLTFFIFLPLLSVRAEALKSYSYDSILVTYKINQDSTIDVTEEQTYDFVGEFHEAWRSVDLNSTSAITDIEVVDKQTGQALTYVFGEQDKLDPSSWGKYTYNKEGRVENIIWYYSQANSKHTWQVKYKLHGAISFGQPTDRLYWNIFTNYDVPVNFSTATIIFPKPLSSIELAVFAYRNQTAQEIKHEFSVAQNAVIYQSSFFSPREAFTVDLGFPAEQVSRASFWLDFLKVNYGYLIAGLSMFLCLLIGLIYWLKTEVWVEGRGTVIAEYEPPLNLRPAIAEVITKETLTNKGLAATIIDLAVRGYLKIEEVPVKYFGNLRESVAKYKLRFVMLFIVILILLAASFFSLQETGDSVLIIIPGGAILILIMFAIISSGKKDYVVRSVKPFDSDLSLEGFEKGYLLLLFDGKGEFSTEELRTASNSTKKEFAEAIKKFKEQVYDEAQTDTKAFDRPLKNEKYIHYFWVSLLVIFFIVVRLDLYSYLLNQMVLAVAGFLIPMIGLVIFLKFEAKLNERGRIIKEEWLGFKLYLEVAERYHMQNLKPEYFEKYLPYAMIFGVEKKWAKAFEALSLSAPIWYTGGYYYGSSGSNNVTSFSPSAFSSSFSASFASAFATSGASGGVGGGGAGGGGGGGGGGGAS